MAEAQRGDDRCAPKGLASVALLLRQPQEGPQAKRARQEEASTAEAPIADSRLPELKMKILAASAVGAKTSVKHQGTAATEYLLKLALEVDQQPFILAADLVPPLVDIVLRGAKKGRAVAAEALGILTVGSAGAHALRQVLERASLTEIVKVLLQMLRDGDDGGAALLANLAALPEHRRPIVRAGAIHFLLSALDNSRATCANSIQVDLGAEVARTFSYLTANANLCDSIIQAKGLPRLIALLESGSTESRLRSALALRNLAAESAERRAAVAAAGSVPGLVTLLRHSESKGQLAAVLALKELAYDASLGSLLLREEALPVLAAVLNQSTQLESREAVVDILKQLASSSVAGETLAPLVAHSIDCSGLGDDEVKLIQALAERARRESA